jgi:hypothetical protein
LSQDEEEGLRPYQWNERILALDAEAYFALNRAQLVQLKPQELVNKVGGGPLPVEVLPSAVRSFKQIPLPTSGITEVRFLPRNPQLRKSSWPERIVEAVDAFRSGYSLVLGNPASLAAMRTLYAAKGATFSPKDFATDLWGPEYADEVEEPEWESMLRAAVHEFRVCEPSIDLRFRRHIGRDFEAL